MQIDIEKCRARLLARRDELENLSDISGDQRGVVALDQQSVGRLSRMDALQQQAMAQATERKRIAEIARIDHALHLLAEGDYGFCETCGEEIAPKRLEADPSIAVCVKCAAR